MATYLSYFQTPDGCLGGCLGAHPAPTRNSGPLKNPHPHPGCRVCDTRVEKPVCDWTDRHPELPRYRGRSETTRLSAKTAWTIGLRMWSLPEDAWGSRRMRNGTSVMMVRMTMMTRKMSSSSSVEAFRQTSAVFKLVCYFQLDDVTNSCHSSCRSSPASFSHTPLRTGYQLVWSFTSV